MKAIIPFSALVILAYSCNNTAPESDSTKPLDSSQSTPIDTMIQTKETLTETVPPPPPKFQEFVVPEFKGMDESIDDVPPPMSTDMNQTADANYYEMEAAAIGPEDKIYDNPEVRPEFKPSQQLTTFINNNLIYPQEALDQGITGIVKTSFIVEKDGSISNVTILTSSGHALLDYEAKRVIKKMPKWSPGKMNGIAVRCRYALPIHFELTK